MRLESHEERCPMSDSVLRPAWLAVAPLEGDALWFNGALQNIKVPGEWSDDASSLVEVVSPRGRATGLHPDTRHQSSYLLEGTILFHIDGEERLAQSGETVAIRRGVPHAFV